MRLPLLICGLVVAATGCHGVRFGRYSDAAKTGATPSCEGMVGPGVGCPPGNGSAAGPPCGPLPGGMSIPGYPPGTGWQRGGQPGFGCPPGATPAQPVCQPPPAREVKAPPVREVRAPVEEVTQTRATSTAVTQDILLIPRTVYVPYAPHVPVSPAKLSMAAPAGRVVQSEEQCRETVAAQPPEARDTRILDALDQCLQQMKRLDQRINQIESRAAVVAPPCAPPPSVSVLPYPPQCAGPGCTPAGPQPYSPNWGPSPDQPVTPAPVPMFPYPMN